MTLTLARCSADAGYVAGQRSSSGWIVWVAAGCVALALLGTVGFGVLIFGAGLFTATRVAEQQNERAAALEAQAAALSRAQAEERRHSELRSAREREALVQRAAMDRAAAQRSAATEAAAELAAADGGTRTRGRGSDDPLGGLDL